MNHLKLKSKSREWLNRYLIAEILGTVGALVAAWFTYEHTHSYVAAAAAGLIGEGIGFYGYFVSAELLRNSNRYQGRPPIKRVALAAKAASTNLIVEFLPAELFDTFVIRPFAMYLAPRYFHPYPLGFLIGKFSADIMFYALAIVGYEARKRWL